MGTYADEILAELIKFIDNYENNPDDGEHYGNWTVGLCDDENDLEGIECEVIVFSGRADHVEAEETRDILLGMNFQEGDDYGDAPEDVYAYKV